MKYLLIVGVFASRLLAVGLGEEQLLDNAHPTSLVNQRLQVATVGKAP